MLINITSFAQTITGPTDVCPRRINSQGQPAPYTYTITGLPQGFAVATVTWSIQNLGTTGRIDGFTPGINSGYTVYNSGKDLSITVLWGSDHASETVKITAQVWEDVGYNPTTLYPKLYNISIRGIDNGSMSGNKTPTKCCSKEITYTVSNVGSYADNFEWINIPAGWKVNGAINLHELKVEPNEQSAGALTCRVRLSCANPSYYKDVTANISRPNAVISLGTYDTLTNKNKTKGICANRQYTY